jgi:propanol-preferring alcohol dehydrogenase
MRALLVTDPRRATDDPLSPADVPPPVPADDELLVRVAASAVCRTDLQIATGDLAPHASPVVPGHQAVGVVEAVGASVGQWAVGDRAGTTWLAGFDGTCEFCLDDRENLCRAATFTGWDRDGGFAELVTVRADVYYVSGLLSGALK